MINSQHSQRGGTHGPRTTPYVVNEYRELERKEMELFRQAHSKLYNPRTPEVHDPLAFASLADAQDHHELSVQIDDVNASKKKIANQLHKHGLPLHSWIKIEGPEAPDEGATAIKVQGWFGSKHIHEIEIDDWTQVIAEGNL